MGPESRNKIQQGFTVAEIIENCHENQEHDKKRPLGPRGRQKATYLSVQSRTGHLTDSDEFDRP
jgi:hypothetical protein